MSAGSGAIGAELKRYQEMLVPLLEVPSAGQSALPADEQRACEAAILVVRGYHGDHLELEEAVAAFARALWMAPGAGEPRAWIALGLIARARHWPEPQRSELAQLARSFAERAFAADPGGIAARAAWARALLATAPPGAAGKPTPDPEAERIAGFLPESDAMALALKSEVAENRGDIEEAIRLKERQLELESDPVTFRGTRNKLGLLLQAAGRLDESVAMHQGNLARHPDYAWGRVNLASALEARGDVLDAFAEVESAVVLGLDEAAPYLEDLAAKLDRASLERFNHMLLCGRDGEPVDYTPAPAAGR